MIRTAGKIIFRFGVCTEPTPQPRIVHPRAVIQIAQFPRRLQLLPVVFPTVRALRVVAPYMTGPERIVVVTLLYRSRTVHNHPYATQMVSQEIIHLLRTVVVQTDDAVTE